MEKPREELPSYCTAEVLVLGCGNPLVGDDGFGPAVAELLLSMQASGRLVSALGGESGGKIDEGAVCIINAGTGSRTILFNLLTGPSRPAGLIIVDALDAGREPGELFWVPIAALSLEKAEDFSLHMTPASNMLYQLEKMGVEIGILACQPSPLPDRMREGLSDAVARAVERAAGMVLERAARILRNARTQSV
ncbi:MAG: hydrogenase maturation protease [Thermoplasmata archaeon]